MVRVVVRDAKLREHDPILGIVNLPLAEVLEKASAVTSNYSLVEGVGFGRANVSILFKSFKVDLPKELRGWDTGTIHISSDIKVELDAEHQTMINNDQLIVATSDSNCKVPGKVSTKEGSTVNWSVDPTIRLPVYSRYQSAVHFNIGGGGIIGGAPEAFASLWLQDLADDEEKEIRIPVITSKKVKQLRQNYVNDETAKTHEFERIGWLTCRMMVDSGLDADHEQSANKYQATRHTFGEFDSVLKFFSSVLIAFHLQRLGSTSKARLSRPRSTRMRWMMVSSTKTRRKRSSALRLASWLLAIAGLCSSHQPALFCG